MAQQAIGEATPRGPNGPRTACNFEDARNFVVVCRVDRATTKEDVIWWVLTALSNSSHAAAFDTFNRTKSAWSLRFVRESPVEIRVLITLRWEGRRYVDQDALTFVRQTPRRPPVMNASEILWYLQQAGAPLFLRSMGVSGIRSSMMDELWDDVRPTDRAVHYINDQWTWTTDEHERQNMQATATR